MDCTDKTQQLFETTKDEEGLPCFLETGGPEGFVLLGEVLVPPKGTRFL